jgi:tetratricopeptide (TPR) repeat protein
VTRPAAIVVAATIFSLAAAADAQQPEGEATAFELNDQGIVAFQEGRFEDAARAFAEAYVLNQDEALRKNEALAWFKAGKCDPAVAAANKFLLVDGILDSDRTDVSAVISNCKVEFARTALAAGDLELAESLLSQAEEAVPDPVVRDRIAGVRVDIATERSRRADEASAAAENTSRPTTSADARLDPPAPGWALYTFIGGLTTVGATFAYHMIALGWQRTFLDMAQDGGDADKFDSLRKRVHTARVLVPVFYTLGVGAAATGAWFTFIAEPPAERGSAPTVGIAAGARF